MSGRSMTRTETKGERKKKKRRKRQNRIPVIAHTQWKKLLHKLFPWALNRLLFSKSGLIGFPLFRNENRIFILNWN